MTELTKTLELKLVDPNAHKREKLRETRAAYQQALQEAFEANCTTLGEANDIVGDYQLSGYAKNALKRYVPQLTTTYGANELSDDHPVRFTNEGVKIDHKPENTIEWYVKIPHHEDYHLWVPAQPNPEQRDWLEAVIAGDADVGKVVCSSGRERGISISSRPVTSRSTPRFLPNNVHQSASISGRQVSSRCVTATSMGPRQTLSSGRMKGRPFVDSASVTSPRCGDSKVARANGS